MSGVREARAYDDIWNGDGRRQDAFRVGTHANNHPNYPICDPWAKRAFPWRETLFVLTLLGLTVAAWVMLP